VGIDCVKKLQVKPIKRLAISICKTNYRLLIGFFVLCLSAIYSSGSLAANRIAFVIGNGAYKDVAALRNPENDATDVAERLVALGFELHEGKVHYNLSERALLTKFNQFKWSARDAEIAFLYFAGHGMQFDGAPHLLPIDIPDADLNIVKREAISLNSLLDQLDGQASLTIAVFDACREIPEYRRAIQRVTRGGSQSSWRGLSRPSVQMASSLVAYSGGSGELVADGVGRNSPYTKILLRNLDREISGPGRNDAPDFFSEVSYQFRQENRGQRPEVINQGVRPNHYFLSERQNPNPPQEKTEVAQNKKQPSLIELEWWNLAKEGGSANSYRTYLEKYPAGEFAEIAKIRVSRLEDELQEPSNVKQNVQDNVQDPETPNSLGQAPERVKTDVPESGARERVTQRVWRETQNTGTISALKEFLEKCGGACEFQSEASARLLSIEEHQIDFKEYLRNNALTTGENGTALKSILSVERLVPKDSWLVDARQEVAERYLQLSRAQQQARKFQSAKRLALKGLTVAKTEALLELSRKLDESIARGDQKEIVEQSDNEGIPTTEENDTRIAGSIFTLPPGHIRESGGAVNVTVLVESENKINNVNLHWSTTPSFSFPNIQKLSLQSGTSNGKFIYTGLTATVPGPKLYYYFSANDKNGRHTSKNTLTFDFKTSKDTRLPARNSNSEVVPTQEKIDSQIAGPKITLPSDHIWVSSRGATVSGREIKFTVHVESENKINSVDFYWWTGSRSVRRIQKMARLNSDRSDGKLVYTELTPAYRGSTYEYYFIATDENGQRTSMGSAASPLTYKVKRW